MWWRAACLLALGAATCVAGAQGSLPETPDEDLPPILVQALEPWTGDFDAMVDRHMVRVILPVSLTTYFIDGKSQKGPAYEFVQHFEKHLKKRLGKRGRNLTVVVIPGRRDEVIDAVVEGRADIAAGVLTVTEERARVVDFSVPLRSDVDEVVVTGPGTKPAASLDELVGIPIHVRRSTSFWGTLERVNAEREAQGAEPLTVVAADELLRTEDLLEMTGAGAIPATVADDVVARVFTGAFDGMVLHEDIALATGRSYAWAFRKGDAKLAEALDAYVKTVRKGSYLGNVITNRYTKSAKWIRNATSRGERKKLAEVIELFRAYGDRYDFDWLMVAAQSYQESGLDHSVKSPVGAIGIMQVMPTTASDPAVGIADIEKLESNVHAGVKYLNLMRDRYFNDEAISALDRELFSFAAYNAGPGNVNKARRRAKKLGLDPNVWFQNVEIAMGQAVSREPVIYVRNIFKYYTAFRLVSDENTAHSKLRK